MKKLVSLLRATMSDGIQIFNYQAKTARARRVMPILLGSLVGVSMLFSATAMTTELQVDGEAAAILSLYTIITAVIIATEGIYKSGDLLFRPRDNDMLLSMPIKKSTIVTARIVKFYAFELVYCLIFLLPAIIAYAITCPVGPLYWLVAITMLIFVPVIPIAFACLAGALSLAASSRFRRKSLFQVLFSFVIMLGFAGLIISVNTTSDWDGQMVATASNKMSEFYYPASEFANLVTNFDALRYLLFVMVNVAVAAVVVLVISRFYFQIVTRLSMVRRANVTTTQYVFREHSQVSAIIRKEINRYFNTPVLLVNTAMGLVLFLVAVVMLCIQYDDITASLLSSEDFPLTSEDIWGLMPSVAFVLVAFSSLMTFITATMISLEGRALNLLKSMPISGVKVILSKVLTAMLLIVPITLVGTLIMAVRFQFGILETFLVLVAVVAVPLVTELIGILIDLKYARFDAENDAVVVKQSAGVMVATFLGLGMVLVTNSLAIGIVLMAGQTIGLIIMDAVFVILALFLLFAVATRGEKKYLRLVA